MTFTRITALWSGAAGLPGYTRMRFQGHLTSAEAATAAGRMRTFFDAIKGQIPTGVNITFSEAAQHYDVLSALVGEVSYTPPAIVSGAGTGGYAAPSGLVVNWLTGAVRNGRKIRGRTFLVPMSGTTFTTAGQVNSTALAAVNAAAAALVAGTPALVIASVWDSEPNVPGPGGGGVTPVTGSSVPQRAAVLRSRRD